jgi:hypothetical protein
LFLAGLLVHEKIVVLMSREYGNCWLEIRNMNEEGAFRSYCKVV